MRTCVACVCQVSTATAAARAWPRPHCNEGELMSVGHQGPSGPFLAPVTRAWLSLAHSTCSVKQAYNYSTCLSTRRSPQVTRCVSVRATVGTVRRCFLFTQPRNSLLIVSWIYSWKLNPFVTLLVFSNSTLRFSSGGRNPSHIFSLPYSCFKTQIKQLWLTTSTVLLDKIQAKFISWKPCLRIPFAEPLPK